MARHALITQNNKFAISLQYLKKKEVSDEVDFLRADKHQSFLQVYFNTLGKPSFLQGDTFIVNGHDNRPQNTQSNKFAIYEKRS